MTINMMLESVQFDLSNVRCIAFDAVGTLIYPTPRVAQVYAAVGRKFGSKKTEREVDTRFKSAMRALDSLSLETNEVHERETWERIVSEVLDDVEDKESCFQELFTHFGSPDAWSCFDDVDKTLSTLRKAGFGIAIASNFDDRLNLVCDGKSQLSWIEHRVISSLVGHRKPSPRFYESLAQAVNRDPHEILMVGDDQLRDVEGARAAGIHAIHLCRSGQLDQNRRDQIQSLEQLLKVVVK